MFIGSYWFLSLLTVTLRPNSFVIITANRVLHCNADTPEEMHHWITLLQRSKGDTRVDGQEFIIRGDDALLHFLSRVRPAEGGIPECIWADQLGC